ncbi:hypothetical protein RXV95_07895 [Novosphingobium sp. ZN18A2]|uniref:hypothetical protein n=1 Tax=Novosphingobium sp. ZN18A2 TaxID=3079861 RepID=UPI0030CC3F36
MTTHKEPAPGHKEPASGKPAKHGGKHDTQGERPKRHRPERAGPDRSGASSAVPPSGHGDASHDDHHHHHGGHYQAGQGESASSVHIDEAVAEAVRTGYDVLSETISQGRRAAEMFRQGNFSIREVPSDIEALARRLLDLARQLSTTTFDICEQLLSQAAHASGPPPPGDTAATVPNFRELKPTLAKQSGPAPPGPTARHSHPEHHAHDTRKLPLAFRFDGNDKVKALVDTIDRPLKPTGAWEISAMPLMRQDSGERPLDDVKFEADLSAGGLVVTINVPDNQPSGVYSGMVVAESQDIPLGFLVVQVEG